MKEMGMGKKERQAWYMTFCLLIDTIRESKDIHRVGKVIYIHISHKIFASRIFLRALEISKKTITSKNGQKSKHVLYKAGYLKANKYKDSEFTNHQKNKIKLYHNKA